MGTVGAVCVAIAVLIAVTFTPAMLGLMGERVLNGRERAALASQAAPAVAKPVRAMSTRRAIGSVLLGVAVLGAAGRARDVDAPRPARRLVGGLGIDPVPGVHHRRREVRRRASTARCSSSPTSPGPRPQDEVLAQQVGIGRQLAAFDDVVAVAPIGTSTDGTTIAFQVVPSDGPSSVSTEQLVKELRAASPLEGGVQIAVAGQASGNIDISQKLADALPLYLALVVGLSLLIMVVVFRSIFVPLIATGGFILSLFAAFGAVVAIFQWGGSAGSSGSTPGPILNFLPTILVGILFGLAMDYMLFLTTGMREAYVHGAPARTAVVLGVRAGRSVVTAAAIIMVSVFGGFIFSESAIIPADRFRARDRRPAGRVRGAHVHRPVADAPRRRLGVVAAEVARPPHPERRRRGRVPRTAPPARGIGAHRVRGGAIEPAASSRRPGTRGSGVTTDET